MPRAPDQVSDATLRLLLAEGIGPMTFRKLRERFGSDDTAAERIVGATISELDDLEGIGRESATALRQAIEAAGAEIEVERAAMRERAAHLVLLEDEDYPALLRTIPDPPAALWMRGSIDAQVDRLALAIVGSRKCSAYGREQAGRFAGLLAQSGLTIVSGGALGIDGEAHRAALRAGGRTIVVAGCGLSTHYPPEHADLFERIVRDGRGALLSEFPMRTAPAAGNFPRRNRIISGLSLGVLVIEAAQRSGALITARLAAEEHHREVMALPGRVDSPASAGCLKALREGWAGLVTSHADVLEQLDASDQLVRGALEASGAAGATKAATLFDNNLTAGQKSIIHALSAAGGAHSDGEAVLVEVIAARTQLPLSQIMADLTLLQIRGRVTRGMDGRVRLKR
jgi:DNA processing protein